MSRDEERQPSHKIDRTPAQGMAPGSTAMQPPGTMTDFGTMMHAGTMIHGPAQAQAPAPVSELPAAGSTIGHYELIRILGSGGMGTVFLARDVLLARLVAIKFLRRQSGVSLQRFLAEARATAQCRHENIVLIYEVDEHNGHPYMTLEYIEGQTLRAYLRERRRQGAPDALVTLPLRMAVELMIPVVRALKHAHELGIVHRDLKPENIMLTSTGAVKVLDFGIAKFSPNHKIAPEPDSDVAPSLLLPPLHEAPDTVPGTMLGTLPYMSPEQWGSSEEDHRCDIWAVGIMLYELTAGRHPLAPVSSPQLDQVADLTVPMPALSDERPDIGPLTAIVDRCLKKRKDERFPSAEALLAELELLFPTGRTPDSTDLGDSQSPYIGLSAFQGLDAGRFFGRDRDIAAVLSRLRSQPLLAIAGPSGAGKSSFVRAGVIPALERSGEGWRACILRPGRQPLAALANAIAEAAPTRRALTFDDRQVLIDRLHAEPGYVGAALRAYCRNTGSRIIVFVDQFEELYTLATDPGERAAFIGCLEGVADDASSPLRVVIAMRSDFLDRVAEERATMRDVIRGLELLPPIDRNGLRNALTRPLEAAGYAFESTAMVDTMIDALARTRSPLPLLQVTAGKLWEARDREQRLVTQASYEALGGVEGALSAYADAVLAGLSVAQQALARAIFLRLVTPERTRAIVTMDELRQLPGHEAEVKEVLTHLADARLLVVEAAEVAGVIYESGESGESGEQAEATVEMVHESLIDKWPRLARWLDESAQDAQFLAQVRMTAKQWDASGRPEGVLWRSQAAGEAIQWLERYRAAKARGESRGELGKREEAYLAAVMELRERAARTRRRMVAGGALVLSGIALALAYLAVSADRAARRAEAEAEAVHREARAARNTTRIAVARELYRDPTSMLVLLREVEGAPTRSWSWLVQMALDNGVANTVLGYPAAINAAALSPDGARLATVSLDQVVRITNSDGTGEPAVLGTHDADIHSLAFSPDGSRIVTGSRDKTARVWGTAHAGPLLVLSGHTDDVRHASFSLDSTRIVTASEDDTARVWNADGSGQPLVLRGHTDDVLYAAFHPDGTRILTASRDQTARIWNADGSGEPLVLSGHKAPLTHGIFSPDGSRIVTASEDHTVRVWNTDGSGEPVVLYGHSRAIRDVKFSPDGSRIVTGSYDNTARLWNADGSGTPIVLEGHSHHVISVAFSPDGSRVITGSRDRDVCIWSVDGLGRPTRLRGHNDDIYAVMFTPDGSRIVTASMDRTVRVWNNDQLARAIILRAHTPPIPSGQWLSRAQFVQWSPDGSRIVTAEGNAARVSNIYDTKAAVILPGHQESIISASFSPDGSRIVTSSADGTARVWNADGSGNPVVLFGHEGQVISASFSPDGSRIATSSVDGTARVWNADGSGTPLVLSGNQANIAPAVFSPDGSRIAAVLEHGVAGIWPADGSGAPVVLRGHDDQIHSIVFSPDGSHIVTTSHDKTARVWNAGGSGVPVVLAGHESVVPFAAFSPDGKRVVTTSFDNTARVWNADGSGQPAVLRGHDAEVIYAAFSPDSARIVTASLDKTARIWNADGSGEPRVLRGHDLDILWAAFSPDGSRVATASSDQTVRIWSDLTPPVFGDERLWRATTYCMPAEHRHSLLGVSKERAATDYERCLRRVREARGMRP